MWQYECIEHNEPNAPDIWRIYDDSDPSYEATICELWSGEHDNEVQARNICFAHNYEVSFKMKNQNHRSIMNQVEAQNAIASLVTNLLDNMYKGLIAKQIDSRTAMEMSVRALREVLDITLKHEAQNNDLAKMAMLMSKGGEA